MIKNLENVKATPKQIAQDILYDQIDKMLDRYGIENFVSSELTEREIELISIQVRKLAKRALKLTSMTRNDI